MNSTTRRVTHLRRKMMMRFRPDLFRDQKKRVPASSPHHQGGGMVGIIIVDGFVRGFHLFR